MVFKKLMGLFGEKPAPESQEEARARQNLIIKAQMREWQLAWHKLFDQDLGQATADNAAKDDEIPNELDRDNRLIHGFCEVSVATRAACFALLPRGAEVAERFEQFYNSRNSAISQEDAVALVETMRGHIKECTVNYESNWAHIEVLEHDDKAGQDALGLEYSVYDIFERLGFDPYPEDTLTEMAASFFLTEPLYAAAGNWYEPGQWIDAVYREPAQDACLRLVYELWLGKWNVLLGTKGVALIKMR